MTSKGASCGELTEFVAHHVFRYKYRDELIAIVYGKSVADKVGRNHRAARPSLDDALLAALVHCENPFFEFWIDEGPFFQRTCHGYSVR